MPRVFAIDGVTPVVHPGAFVHPRATLIGDVIVGAGCYIGPGASLRGDFGRIEMRAGGNVQDSCVVHGFPDTETLLEEDAHIGHGAVLHGCVIKRDALIGMNAVVMDGAVIGESAFVAACAFVKAGMIVGPRMLVAGIPAKVMRELSDREIAWKGTGTAEYQELTRRSHATMIEVEALTAVEPNRPRIKVKPTVPLYVAKTRS